MKSQAEISTMDIYREHALHPITSAKVVHIGSDKILLAGEGNSINLFSLTSSYLLRVIQVFEAQTIHGISHFILPSHHAATNVLLALWGGRSLALVSLCIRQNSDGFCVENIVVESKQELNDWILDAKFARNDQGSVSSLVLLDVQNSLLSLKFSGNTFDGEFCLLAQGPPSALYCGDIRFSSPDDILVAVGTVFGGVHIWSTTLVGDDTTSKQLIKFAGHEGSVFDISLTKLEIHDSLQWIILTCSDDRTIKIWNAGHAPQENGSEALFHETDTGFSRSKPEKSLESLIASGAGHVSRIWRILAIPGTGPPFTFVSFGEDATVQFWYLQGKIGSSSLSLTKGRSTKLHSGKSIWAAAISEDQTVNQSQVVTGGADGRIVISSVGSLHSQPIWSSKSPENGNTVVEETFGSHCWLDSSRLLAVTLTGSIFLGEVEHTHQRPAILWTLIAECTELSRQALLAAAGPGYVLIAGSAGHVYLFSLRERKVELLQQVSCNISFLSALYWDGKDSKHRISIFIAIKGTFKLQLGVIDPKCSPDVAVGHIFCEIPLPPGFTITTAQYLGHDILAFGSRAGDVIIYRVDNVLTLHLLTTIHNVHQGQTVTSITAIGSREWMLTTGRDGSFKIHKILHSENIIDAFLVHSGILPFGPDIEGARVYEGKLQIWGFRGQEFVLWNHGLQQELFSVDCGGRHRNWSFLHGTISGLAWTRAGVAYVASLQSDSVVLQPGTHGREIKALAIRSNQDTLGHIIATGAEDTCIRLARYDNARKYQTSEIVRGHTTGLQKLAWSSNGRFLLSAAGREEFFIWEIQSVPIIDIGVRLVTKCPPTMRTPILRIMDFDLLDSGETYTILMVYSDSTIRVWQFNLQDLSWNLLREAVYGTCCITQCRMLGQYYLTASTDGSLVLWSAADLSQLAKQHIHQSSIKCLDVVLQDDYILIATGGDDGALAFCILDTNTLLVAHPSTSIPWHVLLVPRAHAAAINALAFIQQLAAKPGQFDLVTVSNDQMVKTWTASVTRREMASSEHWYIDITRRSKHASSVADASCVQVSSENDSQHIVVAGIGLEFWKREGSGLVDEHGAMR